MRNIFRHLFAAIFVLTGVATVVGNVLRLLGFGQIRRCSVIALQRYSVVAL